MTLRKIAGRLLLGWNDPYRPGWSRSPVRRLGLLLDGNAPLWNRRRLSVREAADELRVAIVHRKMMQRVGSH